MRNSWRRIQTRRMARVRRTVDSGTLLQKRRLWFGLFHLRRSASAGTAFVCPYDDRTLSKRRLFFLCWLCSITAGAFEGERLRHVAFAIDKMFLRSAWTLLLFSRGIVFQESAKIVPSSYMRLRHL